MHNKSYGIIMGEWMDQECMGKDAQKYIMIRGGEDGLNEASRGNTYVQSYDIEQSRLWCELRVKNQI